MGAGSERRCFWVDGRQPFPYQIMEGLPVIRQQPGNSSARLVDR
jgi:hypothetical protein